MIAVGSNSKLFLLNVIKFIYKTKFIFVDFIIQKT